MTVGGGSERTRIEALTGLRFLAAALVLVHHIVRHFRPGLIPSTDGPFGLLVWLVNDALYMGNQAVSFFFVLSGAVLAYTYLDSGGGLRGTRKAFYWARLARLYPAYLVGFLIAAPFAWAQSLDQGVSPAAVGITALGLVQGWPQLWTHTVAYIWNDPGWSLSVEALFYLLFPLLLPLAARLRGASLSIALLGTAYVSLRLPVLVNSTVCTSLTADQCSDIVATFPPMRLPEFTVGLLFGIALVRRPRWLDLISRVPVLLALELVFFGLVFMLETPLNQGPGTLDLLWVVLIGACARPGVARWLSSRPLRTLGEASYSIYLLHWPLWTWYTLALRVPEREPAEGFSSVLLCTGYVLVVIGSSLVTWRFIELPSRRALRGLLSGRHQLSVDQPILPKSEAVQALQY